MPVDGRIPTLSRGTTAEEVATLLRDLIMGGTLKPGEQLREEGLSHALTRYLIPKERVNYVRDQLDLCALDERKLFPDLDGVGSAAIAAERGTRPVGDAIFSTYLVPFEVVSVLLLAALVGAIVLARRD